MKLTNIKPVGRYINPETNRPVNVKIGRWMTRGVDIRFFTRSGSRVIIDSRDFYSNWKKVD